MMDANQVWDVDEAIANMARLAEFDPYWIEEPTHADDVLGHAAHRRAGGCRGRCRVATGEVAANRVIFKQLLQAEAIGVCRSTPAGSAGSTRCSPSCCWRPSSACRSARTPAASASASTSSTWRSSTTCGSARSLDGPDGRVRRPPARALRRPGHAPAAAATCCPSSPATAPRMQAGVDRRVLLPGRPGMAVTAAAARPGRAGRLPAERRPLVEPGEPAAPASSTSDSARSTGPTRRSTPRRRWPRAGGDWGIVGVAPRSRRRASTRSPRRTSCSASSTLGGDGGDTGWSARSAASGTPPPTRPRSSRCWPTRRSGWSR